MEEDAAALQAKPPHNLVLEFDDAEYAAIEQAALLKPETVREWAKRVLNEAAEIDAAEFVARLKAQASESILAFPEIPLLHAAAGSPAPSDAETFAPTRSYGAGRFACQLHGESMAPKYPDGSTVILRDRASLKRPLLKNGEIYLFDVGGEKTLKIYQSRPATEKEIEAGISYVSPKDGLTKVRTLRPINPAFQEIVIDGEAEWIGWLDEKDNSPQA